MTRSAAVLLALLAATHSAAAQHTCSASDTARVRTELTAIYGTLREAFMRNAPQPWIDALTPSFSLTLFDGRVMPRTWVEEYVRANATQFRVQTLAMSVRSITRTADTVVATVEQTSDRESTDAQGIRHRLEVGALQLETWVCTVAGWRLAGGQRRQPAVSQARRQGAGLGQASIDKTREQV